MSGVLRVDVETLANSLGRAVNVMEALEQNIRPQKQESIGFTNINGMLSVFTPKRWILIETLCKSEAMSIHALAKLLNRNFEHVYTDVYTLIEWGIVNIGENDLLYLPYNEFIFHVKLNDNSVL